jgi:two-component system sensor histidine kinase DegS
MNERSDSNGQKILDGLMLQLIQTLEKGRDDIYLLAEASYHRIQRLQLELEDLDLELTGVMEPLTEELKGKKGDCPVSSEAIQGLETNKIEELNTAGQLDSQLQQNRMQRKRDMLQQELQSFKAAYRYAYEYLNTTHMAIKILQGQPNIFHQPKVDVPKGTEGALWLLKSQELERRKIARELHDGPAQTLAAVLMHLDFLQGLGGQDLDSLQQKLDLIKDMSRECLNEIRRILFDLKPVLLEEDFYHSLQEYLRELQFKYNLQVEFSQIGEKRKYDLLISGSLFRIIQEAMSNIRKHAHTEKATLRLEDSGNKITLIIQDQGAGFDPQKEAPEDSYGILSMKERVQLLGGVMKIDSEPGAGTQITIIVPLEGEENNEREG